MPDTNRGVETLSNRYPDAEPVGEHLIIDRREWVPGEHPEPHLRAEGQTEYLEAYYRCLVCGVEVLATDDLPETCEGESR